MTSPASADERFAPVAAEIRRRPGVSTGRMFGSDGLKVANKVFAMLVKGRLVVKLPKDRVEALIAEGAGERFDPGHGRLMKEWLAVEPGADLDWLALADEAMRYVAGDR